MYGSTPSANPHGDMAPHVGVRSSASTCRSIMVYFKQYSPSASHGNVVRWWCVLPARNCHLFRTSTVILLVAQHLQPLSLADDPEALLARADSLHHEKRARITRCRKTIVCRGLRDALCVVVNRA